MDHVQKPDGSRTVFAVVLVCGLALQAALGTTAFLTTNADYNFPGIVELLLIGVALGCLAAAFRYRHVWEPDDGRVAVVLVVLLAALAVRYVAALRDPVNAQALGCFAMPGVASVECLLQLPYWANYGLRQLLMHTTALAIFWAAAGLARLSGGRVAELAPVFLVTPVLFAVAALAPKLDPAQQSLAGWNFVFNKFSATSRGSGIVSNPGWLWPLLAAPGALAVGLLASRAWNRVLYGAAALAVILAAVVDSGQRGAYLLIVLLATCAAVYLAVWRVPAIAASWRRRTALWGGMGAGALVAVLVGARYIGDVMKWLAQFSVFAGLGTKALTLTDPTRAFQRQCAWDNTLPVLWSGNGYASWLRIVSDKCPDPWATRDTAHNLWVQMFFELGLVHAVIAGAVIAWLLYRAVLIKTNRLPEIEAAVLAIVPAFLLASVVQEVDYVPATYYLFASVGGCLWGASRAVRQDSAEPVPAIGRRRLVPAVVACLGLLALAGSAAYATSISWGGYTYVPVDVPGFRFTRWFRPSGVIAAAPDSFARAYSVFPVALLGPPQPKIEPGPRERRPLAITATGITLSNGTAWRPRQYRYRTPTWDYSLSRLNGFAVFLPPLQTDFLVLGEESTSQWEVSATGTPEKWCLGRCTIDFATPLKPGGRNQVWLYVEQPCTSSQQPARVDYTLEVRIYGRSHVVPAQQGTLRFDAPSVPQAIMLPPVDRDPDFWRLELVTTPGCAADVPPRGRSGPGYTGVRVLLGQNR